MINKIITILIVVTIVFSGWLFYSNNSHTEITSQTNVYRKDKKIEIIEGARIKIDPDVYDLGTVIFGDVPERIFEITNIGNQDLEILKISTSCGCTKASVAEKDKIISPGDSVDMLVTFDPAVHGDNTDLGDLVRVIYIKTNDSNKPEVEVEIRANVIKKE